MSVKMKFGSKDIPFVYKGDKLVYPNPIKDGLLLWYDFRGMRNTDTAKEVAKDLSGNGNDGTLQNFNYSTSDFKIPDLYKTTRLIVKDPSDPIYSDYPNPPVGAVFNNYNPVSNKIVRGNIDMPALVNTLVANMKLYHLHSDSIFLENAKIIGDYISSLMRNFSFYGADTWVVPNRVSLIDGEWTPLYGEINTRSLLQAMYALSEVLKVTGLYGSEVYQLTQTIGLIHNNIKSRVTEGELRTAMNGAVYEYIYANEDTNALVFSWGEFGISSSDMIAKAINSYIESMGEDIIYDSQGTEFTPRQLLDGAAEHIKAVYDSGVLTMEPTGLPYSFLQANSESETGLNWDWVDTQERGDTWFTNDTTLWIIEGISRLSQLTEIEGIYNIAKTYRDNFLALRELNHDSYDDKGDTRVIFYDRYNFDGSHLTDDVSISISGTALLWEIDEILSIKDGVLHSRMRNTLEAHIITDKNSDINGAFGWDANNVTSFIEMKATGEIYSSPFIQVGSSVSSGYKDNTLVFDGVDDKLTIPELVLDETAMSVMHDGKIYSYEDDKVLTVGEDGEIVGSGKNLYGNHIVIEKDQTEGALTLVRNHPNAPFGFYTVGARGNVSFVQLNNIFPQEGIYTVSWELGGNQNTATQNAISTHEGVASELFVNPSTSNETKKFSYTFEVTDISTQNWLRFDRLSWLWYYFKYIDVRMVSQPVEFSPNPSDLQKTTFAPSHLESMQIYNKTLNKTELLHNAESKGLKKLKPGVVVQDGLVLHYDFSHESNTSEYKDKAFDYSGNGHHGELQNFNFTEESGYDGNKLKFDGVDDYIGGSGGSSGTDILGINTIHDTVSFTVKANEDKRNNLLYASEILKIDIYGTYVRKADISPNLVTNHDMMKKPVSVSYVRYDGGIKVYIDGELVSDNPYNNESFKELQLYSIGFYVANGRPNVELYDVKIYNRPLTDEEIAHNYAIEKEKINITEGDA